MSEKRISIVLGEETWRAARLRAVAEGMTFQDLGAKWFGAYAGGGRGLAAGDQPADGKAGDEADVVVDPSPAPKASADRGGANLSAPAARPCSQAFKHHINHSGRPCKECGYPVKGAV